MISENDRLEIIEYRINQSKEVIAEVEKLITSGLLKVAVNRIYYGMFYILNAMALKYGFQTSKHLQLIGWLNKDFIKPGLIDKKYGEILRNAFKNRTDGDYAPFIEFTKNDVIEMFSEMKDFIYFIESFIHNPN